MSIPANETALLIVYMIGKCCIATVMSSIYVYTSELYPTKHRNSLFAFSSMMGRIGSILAPLTPALVSFTIIAAQLVMVKNLI